MAFPSFQVRIGQQVAIRDRPMRRTWRYNCAIAYPGDKIK
jgi:hypothetical protein